MINNIIKNKNNEYDINKEDININQGYYNFPLLKTKSIAINLPKENNIKTKKTYVETSFLGYKDKLRNNNRSNYYLKNSEEIMNNSNLQDKMFKTRICKQISKGNPCWYSDKCNFAHFSNELRTSDCKSGKECRLINYVNNRYINNEDRKKCKFLHPGENKKEYFSRMHINFIEEPKPWGEDDPITEEWKWRNYETNVNGIIDWNKVIKAENSSENTDNIQYLDIFKYCM